MSFSLLISAGALLAQQSEIPLHNWTVPPYRTSGASGGLTTMTDVTPPRAFIGIQPCRVADTRGNGAPITGGIFANSEQRTWDVTGICGIPAGADAISVNFTVVSASGIPAGSFLLAWPTGQSAPPTAIMTYGPSQVLSNAAIVPLGPSEQLNVNVSGSTHVIMDVNGYFSDTLGTPGNSFLVSNNSPNYSIAGVNASTAVGAMAVSGRLGAGNPCITCLVFGGGVVGVAGSNDQTGVLGVSTTGYAVDGYTTGGTGMSPVAEGSLGVPGTPFNYGVYANGDYGGSGAKYFVEPHPHDASKVIRYAALEGPEAGTYFRGRGKFQNGTATIAVPEDFRLVTDPDSLSVVATPIGPMATVSVASIGLDRIVLRASRSVEFFYLVQGERRSHKGLTPIVQGREYMPRRADEKIPLWLTQVQKEMLISNGTYNEDGTVNTETARRLGWDEAWEKRARPAPQPTD